ncbi:hypothetical protein BC826DRAFT_1177757 [Russula brevipes]|nr:hypothetical protein BC826DRAFT_1177757 [Russula brevipes]
MPSRHSSSEQSLGTSVQRKSQSKRNIYIYKKGVSLLLRDSLEIPGGNSPTATTEPAAKDHHVCIMDHKATVRERVGDLLFFSDYLASSFFQSSGITTQSFSPSPRISAMPSSRPHPRQVIHPQSTSVNMKFEIRWLLS